MLEDALLAAERAAAVQRHAGESAAAATTARRPAGWWRDPDGGATPTFIGGASGPPQWERPDGAPPLRLGEQVGDWQCPRYERRCPAWHRKRSPTCRACGVARPPRGQIFAAPPPQGRRRRSRSPARRWRSLAPAHLRVHEPAACTAPSSARAAYTGASLTPAKLRVPPAPAGALQPMQPADTDLPLERATTLGITELARIHSALGNLLAAHGCSPVPALVPTASGALASCPTPSSPLACAGPRQSQRATPPS